MKTVLVFLVILISGCASIEQRCLEAATQNAPAELQAAYFNSCVVTRRQTSEQIQKAFSGFGNTDNNSQSNFDSVNCTSRKFGTNTYTNCQ